MADALGVEANVALEVQQMKQFLDKEMSWLQEQLGTMGLRALDPKEKKEQWNKKWEKKRKQGPQYSWLWGCDDAHNSDCELHCQWGPSVAAEAVQGHLLQISEVPEQNLSLHAVSREDDAREFFFAIRFLLFCKYIF